MLWGALKEGRKEGRENMKKGRVYDLGTAWLIRTLKAEEFAGS